MSLIEHLDQDNWEDFLRSSFEYTLDVLKNDRFRTVGSAVDDLMSWLTCGGMTRVKEHLNNQMGDRRFSAERKVAVNGFLEQLVQENRSKLLGLMIDGVIAPTKQEWLADCDISELQVQDLLSRISSGERLFEDWMYTHGYSDQDIAEIYRLIDQWLMQRGRAMPLPSLPVTIVRHRRLH